MDMKGAILHTSTTVTSLPYTTVNIDLKTKRILSDGVYVVEVRKTNNVLVGTKKIVVKL